MARLIFAVSVLMVAVVGMSQAAPAGLTLQERELLFKYLMAKRVDDENTGNWDWIWATVEESTTAPTTTVPPPTTPEVEPEPEVIEGVGGSSDEIPAQLTSGQLCTVAQAILPPRGEIQNKRDLVVNLIYHICLPSVGRQDLAAIGLLINFLEGNGAYDFELSPTTTPKPESLPDEIQELLDALSDVDTDILQVEDAVEDTEEEEEEEEAGGEEEQTGEENNEEGTGEVEQEATTAAAANADETDAVNNESAGGSEPGETPQASDQDTGGETGSPQGKSLSEEEMLKLLLRAVEKNKY